jgi:hypothetical protein
LGVSRVCDHCPRGRCIGSRGGIGVRRKAGPSRAIRLGYRMLSRSSQHKRKAEKSRPEVAASRRSEGVRPTKGS